MARRLTARDRHRHGGWHTLAALLAAGLIVALACGQDDGAPLGDEFLLQPTGEPVQVAHGPRVGISVAADWPLRFWIIGDPTVSPYRRGRATIAGIYPQA